MVINKLQKIILAAAALICIGIIAFTAVTIKDPEGGETTAISLSFDPDAKKGTPEISDKTAYAALEIPLSDNDKCIVSMDAAPVLKGNRLEVYFTNSAENKVWLRIALYNAEDDIIGYSGIIRNGEYVEAVELYKEAAKGDQLKVKILTYEADTYYSLGSAGATITIR